jgi:hypothetical protein
MRFERRPSLRFLAGRVVLAVLGASLLAGCTLDRSPGASVAEELNLAETEDPQQIVEGAFDPNDADQRRRSVIAIATGPYAGEAPYPRLYRLLLDDPDPTVRAAAVAALGRHGGGEHAEPIAGLLEDNSDFVRWEAARALQRLHNLAAVEALKGAVQTDEAADVRMAAAKALGQYPRRDVFDVLIGGLGDLNHGVVQRARASLRTLTGQSFEADPGRWLAWADKNRGRLFENGRVYMYQPYQAPPGLLARTLLFWRYPRPRVEQTPVGLNAQAEEDRSSNG